MQLTTDSHLLDTFETALASLVNHMEYSNVVSVLKAVVCVGTSGDRVLAALEKKSIRTFEGDVWTAVAWAKERGIDVD
jgi:hypothetical protein